MTARLDAQVVGAVLAELREGAENAVPGHVIARRLGISRLRTVGEAIRFLRAERFRTGAPQIAGDGRGYWIVQDAGELARPRKTLRSRALATLETAKWCDPEFYRRAESQGLLAFLREDAA